MLRGLGESVSQAYMDMWAAGYHPQVRVAIQQGGVRGHKVELTGSCILRSMHADSRIQIMPRCRPSQEMHNQPVYVAFILIKRRCSHP